MNAEGGEGITTARLKWKLVGENKLVDQIGWPKR